MSSDRPLRIGVDGRYIQDHFPGIGRYTYRLVDALGSLDTQDRILVFHNPKTRNTRYDVARLGRHSSVELVRTSLDTMSVAEQLGWWRVARRYELDVLYSPYYVKPYLLPCPSVVAIHDAISKRYPAYMPSRTAGLAFSATTRLSIATSRAIVTLSDASRDDLVQFFGVKTDKIVVTHLAADEDYRAATDDERAAVRAKLSLPEQFVLYVGINKPHKNLATLVDAWSDLKLRRPELLENAKLVLGGREDYRYPQTRRRAAKLGLVDDVVFLGDIQEADLPALYSSATVFAFPSLTEGFGLPPLEAMACGVPVVCSNTSSLPEVVGDAALLVDPLASGDWSSAFERLLEDCDLRADMSRRGIERSAKFSWLETARTTLAVLRKVAK